MIHIAKPQRNAPSSPRALPRDPVPWRFISVMASSAARTFMLDIFQIASERALLRDEWMAVDGHGGKKRSPRIKRTPSRSVLFAVAVLRCLGSGTTRLPEVGTLGDLRSCRLLTGQLRCSRGSGSPRQLAPRLPLPQRSAPPRPTSPSHRAWLVEAPFCQSECKWERLVRSCVRVLVCSSCVRRVFVVCSSCVRVFVCSCVRVFVCSCV